MKDPVFFWRGSYRISATPQNQTRAMLAKPLKPTFVDIAQVAGAAGNRPLQVRVCSKIRLALRDAHFPSS